MGSLRDRIPSVYWFFQSLVTLYIGELTHINPIFLTGSCPPGINFRLFAPFFPITIHDFLTSIEAKPGEVSIIVSDLGHYYPSQVERIEETILNTLNKRNNDADALLGRELADHFNVLHKASPTMIPRLNELFPLSNECP